MIIHFRVSECITTEGENAGKCIFPFTYNGKTCPGPTCCNLDNASKGAWCSTKVDANGNHIDGNYGYCKGTVCGGKFSVFQGEHLYFELSMNHWRLSVYNPLIHTKLIR